MIQLLVSWMPVGSWAGFIFLLSSRPYLPGPPGIPFADKILHVSVYLILGISLAWAWRHGRQEKTAHFALLFGGVVFALSDEWHQSFVPGRDPSGGDLIADVVGLALGYALGRRLFRRCGTQPVPSGK